MQSSIKCEKDTTYLWQSRPLVALDPLPEADGTFKMSMPAYVEAVKNGKGFHEPKKDDDVLKNVIFNEVEKIPQLWDMSPGRKGGYYAKVAIATYKRTGKLLSTRSINDLFKDGKLKLKSHLKQGIEKKGMMPDGVEKHMWELPFYGHIRFYRRSLLAFERNLKKAMNKKSVGKKIYYDVNDGDVEPEPVEQEYIDDDLIVGELAGMPSMEQKYSVTSPFNHFNIPLVDYDHNAGGQIFMNTANMEMAYGGGSATPSTSTPQPNSASDFADDVTYFARQLERIARQQPDQIHVLRLALSKTVTAFDCKKYNDVNELFRDLAK